MKPISRIQELTTLKTIAETLNQSSDLSDMLEAVLEKLLDMTGLTFGWIFLMENSQEYIYNADRNLPHTLTYKDKSPMICGSCWCMDPYRTERLTDAVNILNCHRLSKDCTSNSDGVCSHVTVPLRVGDRKLGLLNVGAAGKERFNDEDLALLQAVALQIGVAVERMRLWKTEQRRKELLACFDPFSRALQHPAVDGLASNHLAAAAPSSSHLAKHALVLLARHFDWIGAALLERTGDHYHVQVIQAGSNILNEWIALPSTETHWLNQLTRESRYVEIKPDALPCIMKHWTMDDTGSRGAALLAVPIAPHSGFQERIFIICTTVPSLLLRVDGEALEADAKQIAAVMERSRLEEYKRELIRVEERTRFASDRYDALSKTPAYIREIAEGAESPLYEKDQKGAQSALQHITSDMKEALQEIRAMLTQLQPPQE